MEHSIGGIKYKFGNINAIDQFHIVRRLTPILGSISKVKPKKKGDKKEDDGLDFLSAVADALANLTDEDADYVLFGLLKPVTREIEGGLGFAPVSSSRSICYDDITMPQMLQIAAKSAEKNMSSFFSVLPSALKEEMLKVKGQ